MNRRSFIAKLVGAIALAAQPFEIQALSKWGEIYYKTHPLFYVANRFGKTETQTAIMEYYLQKGHFSQ